MEHSHNDVLLTDTLRNLWENYLKADEDLEVKHHWLQQFLYHHQYISNDVIIQNTESKSFFISIPEEICSFFLRRVYEIISQSEFYKPTQLGIQMSLHENDNDALLKTFNSQDVEKLLKMDQNFTQLILRTPSDCNKIVALRTFLTHQLGQHILQFLLLVDIKLIASQKSLCNLCINLFPNCCWADATNAMPLLKAEPILNYIAQLHLHHRPQLLSKAIPTSKDTRNLRVVAQDFHTFASSVKSSDEIAVIVIDLLGKCVANEREDALLTEQSMSTTTLNFVLESLLLEPSTTFSNLENAAVIRSKLLQLLIYCLNNLFAHDENVNLIQMQFIIARLVCAMETIYRQSNAVDLEVRHILFGQIYIIFGILNNIIALSCNVNQLDSNSGKFIDEPVFDVCMQIFHRLLQEQQEQSEKQDAVINLLCSSIFKMLLKIIDTLYKYDQQKQQQGLVESNFNKAPRRKKLNTRQIHCHAPTLSCFFQRLLFNILPHVPTKLQEYAAHYLMRSGSCCCHYTTIHLATWMQFLPQITLQAQKCLYKFIYRKALTAIFVRSSQLPGGKRRNCQNCHKCDDKLKSIEFHANLLQLYRQLYERLYQLNDAFSLILYLKHLKRVAHLLTNDIASGVLAEIVLPIFRHFKVQALTQSVEPLKASVKRCASVPNQASLNDSKMNHFKILHECLNTFVIYLNDLRLIKAFYNEENIKHLEDLLTQPQLIRAICELFKIGIDNITFLGDHAQEQSSLSRRLITLQLQSSDQAAKLFTTTLKRFEKYSTMSCKQFWLDNTELRVINDDLKLDPLETLYIAALQWSFNYELLKTSQCFYNEFAKIYSIVELEGDTEGDTIMDQKKMSGHTTKEYIKHSTDTKKSSSLKHGDKTIMDILKLNYNALSSYLLLPRKKQQPTAQNDITHIETSFILQLNPSINKLFASQTDKKSSVYLSSTSLETLVSSMMSNGSPIANDYQAIYVDRISSNYEAINELFYLTPIDSSFSQQLRQRNLKDDCSVLLFDIRHQSVEEFAPLAQSRNVFNFSKTDLSGKSTRSELSSTSETGIISRLYGMFGTLFRSGRSTSLNEFRNDQNSESQCRNTMESNVIDELKQLCESNSDYKKLLLKLFESTMAICIKGYQNEQVEEMQKHLRKLKTLILSSAANNWEEYSEEHSHNQNLIIQALQTLLKIAELSNKLKDPTAVLSSNSLRTEGEDVGVSTLSRTRAASIGSSSHTPLITSSILTGTQKHPSLTIIATSPPSRSRPLSAEGKTAEFDYFSTGASFIPPDSEVELSENEQDEFYHTGDEGYEADAEYPEVSDTEGEMDAASLDLWTSFQGSSRYRSHVLHTGLCQLVVEILMELSCLCVNNPVGWCENLAQLANRLFVIREYLGGPLFLLQGFGPVLECNDVRLRELQQSLLELIVDLNTPNVLSTFLGILAKKNPPVDILLKYLGYICSANGQKQPQPTIELEYPVLIDFIDGKCVSTSMDQITDQIDQVRNYHLHMQAITPFTRAPCIIPVTHAKVWGNEGFTVSMWVQVKTSNIIHKSSSQIIDDETRSMADGSLKSHLISIGSDQAMLSVYINCNMNLVFETCRPNTQLKPLMSPQSDEINENFPTSPGLNATSPKNAKLSPRLLNMNSCPGASHSSTLRNALKPIKLLVLNSFNHMHIFNGHTTDITDSYFEGTSVDLKYFQFAKNKWTHVCFAIDIQPDFLTLTVIINALEQHVITLPFRNLRGVTQRNEVFQLIALGDGYTTVQNKPTVAASSSTTTTATTDSRSTIEGNALRFAISNLLLFNRKIAAREILLNLTAMGPDFHNLTQCQVGNLKPNYGLLNTSKMHSASYGNFAEAIKYLRDARVLTYTAQQPDVAFGCEIQNVNATEPLYAHQLGIMLYGPQTQNYLKSFQTATILCGGISTLLYLFARVVETTNNPVTEALALDILISVAITDAQLFTEFQRLDFISLIGFVIRTERCSKDVLLLRSIINNACSQPLIVRKGSEALQVNVNSSACLVYPRLLISVLHRYADWHRCGAEHSAVLDMLLSCILALTRDKHPYKDFNIEQLIRVGLVKELLNLCKVYIIESPNPVHISIDAAKSFVQILSVFAGSPPSPSLMDEIMKLLLLLHKPSECYVTHDRSKFYFLLKPQPPPTKDKTASTFLVAANLSRVTIPLRRSFSRYSPGDAVALKSASKGDEADMDAQRDARINKLKKLHMRNSPYKRVLLDFEDNLENIADCTRLNKQALRLVSPIKAATWRQKFKRHLNLNSIANHKKKTFSNKLHKVPSKTLPSVPPKIARKRIRMLSTNSLCTLALSDSEKRRCRYIGRGSQGSLQYLAATLEAFDNELQASTKSEGINEVFNVSPPSTMSHRVKRYLAKTDFYSSAGIITLQEGLFNLLKDFLCLLPDSSVEDVLRHYVKVEFLLVLANHSSCSVRTAIIRLLSALTKRLTSSDLQQLNKNYFPQHLGNQLSIYPTDVHMFEACLEWVCGYFGRLDAFPQNDCVRIENRFGLNALLAVLSKTQKTQITFITKAFNVLQHIYVKDSDENQTLHECGLLQCCMKALYNLYTQSNVISLKPEEAVIALLSTIGERCFKSIGHMNIIWDILNMLSFYQEREAINVANRFRSVQGQLLLNWLILFFKNSSAPTNFKISALPGATISISETKTRLDLLIDRCSQFFTVLDGNYAPSEKEIKLFELLVSYSIATNQRCNNFIAWGLQPSRPHTLRSFIIDALWMSCQDEFVPAIICDGKMIKSLLWLCLLEDLPQPIENLKPLCHHLGINETDSAWNLENELGRIEVSRCNISVKQKSLLEKTVYKFEQLAVSCIESSMVLTRLVAELQNSERKLIMSQMKEYDETQIYAKWLDIIKGMTHEGAPWYSQEYAENSWELDDTEGPSRVHTRMRRCHLDIDKRFIMEDYRRSSRIKNRSTDCSSSTLMNSISGDDYSCPLEYLISSYDQQLNISFNSQILYNFPAKYLPVDGEIDGEIIVTDHKLCFLATYHCKYFYVCCDINNITEIWLKRYQHQEKAFEIFLDTNRSLFFSLQNQEDLKIIREVFCDKIITPPDQSKVLLITQQWREGLLTNWEYLMTLNQIAGRTYNDLMQYPVFPWILSNYVSEVLDLTDIQNFRKLHKPIAVQKEENEQHYINNYTYISNTMTNMGSMILKPYHYSSHYSNSGTVLHFLVRVPPFTSYFLRYQDNNFDLPDRTFHALNTTWGLASRDSPTDVKELIPEFFSLPEMFENFERFNFGCRQNGERVEDVALPPWCNKDPRLFVLIHRQALESELVRNNLHNWIDLIFGYKQTGDHAVEAINVFHPATYSVFIESEITDQIERKAVETMVKTYGQMPRQLFKQPHPPTKSLNYCLSSDKKIMLSVHGLRWGVYAGSPQLPEPVLGNIYKLPGAEYLVSFNNTNVVYGLPMRSCVMQGAETDTFNVISWGHEDRIVRIQTLNKTSSKPKNLLHNTAFDDITACGTDPNSNQLWCGHRSGRISVYKCSNNDILQRTNVRRRQSYAHGLRLSYNSAFRKLSTKGGLKLNGDTDADASSPSSLSATSIASTGTSDCSQKDGADLFWIGPTVLVRHTDEITCLTLSVEFKIAISAGRDGIAVIWDLNNWNYLRTIERPAEIHQSPITKIAVSPTLGDIVTVHAIPQCNGISSNDVDDEKNSELPSKTQASNTISPDECFEVTEENLDDFVNVSVNPNGKSILRLHSVNARYIQHIVNEERILAVCYSFIKEGVGVNVIATALEGGLVRLWSSWNLSFVRDIVTGISDIKSLTYSTHQHLVVLTAESRIQVWESNGLYGNPPKFPQIVFK